MNDFSLRVELVPIFEDNYVFVIIDPSRNAACVVDPGEFLAVEAFLKKNNLTLQAILLTHHHQDHVAGVGQLANATQAKIYAPLKNKNQLSKANAFVNEGDTFSFGSFEFNVLELPGHTLGHVAYWFSGQKWLFSGDVLFGLGCGRIFEGTYEQMYQSLQRIKELPAETLIYCTHEYTERNLDFCKMLSNFDDTPITGENEYFEIYENELLNRRKLNLPSVPLKLAIEKKVNPFLLASDVQQFQHLRELRNKQ